MLRDTITGSEIVGGIVGAAIGVLACFLVWEWPAHTALLLFIAAIVTAK